MLIGTLLRCGPRSLLTLLVFGLAVNATAAAADWRGKVAPELLRDLQSKSSFAPAVANREGPEAEFFVFLAAQADLADAEQQSGFERGPWVVSRLRALAESTQYGVVSQLEALGLQPRVFWVANMVWVKGDVRAVEAMARRGDVARVLANPKAMFAAPVPEAARRASVSAANAVANLEPGLSLVGAPEVWALGIRGENVVVAGADTGVQWDHPALLEQYRGWNGLAAVHDYAWHDAIHSGGGICGPDAIAPCDDNGHGTHTLGTMVGDDGGTNQTGMAPAARWIACRNMDEGVGSPASYSECFQWFLAPTDLNDANPDPSLAPDVINNSWRCPPSEGCGDPLILQTVVENTRAAGIVVVVAASNEGPACGSVSTPTAIYDASFAVGATNLSDGIASFSARGPVTVDGSNRLKPEVTAPGVSVRSTLLGGSYGTLSGTSMAAPHVAGLVALLISSNPVLSGRPGRIQALIAQTALPLTTTQGCGGDTEFSVPNNVYGYGRIQALAAVEAATVNVPTSSLPALAVLAPVLCGVGVLALRARARGIARQAR